MSIEEVLERIMDELIESDISASDFRIVDEIVDKYKNIVRNKK